MIAHVQSAWSCRDGVASRRCACAMAHRSHRTRCSAARTGHRPAAGPRRSGRTPGDPRRAARACRYARPHQRSRPHRLGRIRARDARGRGRGVTTLVDMPLNSIPATTTSQGSSEARGAKGHVDVGFWGGVVPGNAGDLEPLARAGVLGFKCFLSRRASTSSSTSARPTCARRCRSSRGCGLPLLVHAELPAARRSTRRPTAYPDLAGQPPAEAERRPSIC